MPRRNSPKLALAVLCLLSLTGVSPLRSQPPVLDPAFPLGIERGTKLELTLTGAGLASPTGLWTSFPAKVIIPTEGNNGKQADRLKVLLEVAADAPVGTHALRLATTQGVSGLRLFCVDDLPQVVETADNRTPEKAQPLSVPCAVAGRADPEARDYFRIQVKAGQRLTFEVLGRRLGSAIDPQIRLLDAQGRDLPGGYSNDTPGRQTDPFLEYTFREAGDALVEVRDVTYRGGKTFFYRLRIGSFPCATTPVPMRAQRGSKVQAHFAGPDVEGVAPVEVQAPADPNVGVVELAPRRAEGQTGWPVALFLSDVPELAEVRPQTAPSQPMRITPPCGVTGRFQQPNERDGYTFSAKKGQRLILEAETIELGSPTEVYMVLRDGKGAQLQASDPTKEPRLDFTAAADGEYTLTVEHLHYWGGPAESYHLRVAPPRNGFSLELEGDRFLAPVGGKGFVPVKLTRQGYQGPVKVQVTGPAGLAGSTTIPEKGTVGIVEMGIPGSLPPGVLPLKVTGEAAVEGKAQVEPASVRSLLGAQLEGLPLPPPALTTSVVLGLVPKPPFDLTASLSAPTVAPGKSVDVTVRVERGMAFKEAVTVAAAGLPAGTQAPFKPIAAGQAETKATLKLAANAPVGEYFLLVSGKAKHAGGEVTAWSAPLRLTLKK